MGESNNNFLGFRLMELFSKMLVLTGFTLVGSFIGQLLGSFSALFILKWSISSGTDPVKFQQMLMDFMQNPTNYTNGQRAFMSIQWFTSLGTFVGAAWAFNRYSLKQHLSDLSPNTNVSWHIYLWTIIAMIVGAPMLEYVIDINKQMAFPSAYKDVEAWMRNSELALEKVTKNMLQFNTHLDFLLGLMTVGFMAALGEELFFRGVVQNLFVRYGGNKHVAIWVAAFIFSFIHFQFYGFFPRLFLGAFFGYLYVWYQNIWVPIVAHFFNNGLAITASYLFQLKVIKTDPVSEGVNNEWYVVVISLILVVFYIRRLYLFKK